MPQQNKAQKTPTRAPRKLSVGLCCLTATCAVLVGCPATPARPTPQDEQCAPEAQATRKRYDLHGCSVRLVNTEFHGTWVEVPVGRIIEAKLIGDCGGLPHRTILKGYLTVEGDRAYPRFTRAWYWEERPDSWGREHFHEYDVCLQAGYNGPGVPVEGGASPGHVKIWNIMRLRWLDHF